MKRFRLLFLLISFSLQAQFQISGVVLEQKTNQPLSFASLKLNSGQNFVTDSKGKFSFKSFENSTKLQISFIGFESKTIKIEPSKSFYSISLEKKINEIEEVKISNKALEIIKKVIAFRNENNPQIKLKTFQFNSYNKLLVTAKSDSIQGRVDSLFVIRKGLKKFKKLDSTEYKFKKLVLNHDLFLAEKVSKFQFNQNLKETVLASRMSGLDEPIYELIGFNLQSFSIYDPYYELFETKYNSPISKNPFSEYRYKVLDTTKIDNRNVIAIYFKNKSRRENNGLEGVLYIDTETFAIAKAVMQTKGVIEISGTHEFQFFEKEQLWFPKNKSFKISKGKNKEDIKILGGTIVFKDDTDESEVKHKNTSSDFTYLISETYNSNFEFNSDIDLKKKSVTVEVFKSAINRKDNFWEKYRNEPLSDRDRNTYFALDSISKKNKVEKRIFLGRKIVNGFLPYNLFDLDLKTILSFNNFEGFRLGIGGTTNEKLSKIFKAEGYTAYGLKDETHKYHIGASIRVGNFSNSWVGFSYTNDLNEIASSTFLTDPKMFKVYISQPISTNTFYSYKSYNAFIETQIIPKTTSVWQISKTDILPKFNYGFKIGDNLVKDFKMNYASFSIQWNPFSDYMQTPRGKIEIDKRYPKFTFQFTQTLPKFLNNDLVFAKVDFKVDWAKRYINGQKTSLLFKSGFGEGDIPITHLYNTSPNSLLNESLFYRFLSIITEDSFETMYFNEFFSDKYVFFQAKHEFKRMKFSKNFGTSIAFINRTAWGNLENKERHVGLDFKTLDKGFYEFGIEFNQIFKGLGVGSFYRYGANSLPGFYDNFAIKASFVLNLGM